MTIADRNPRRLARAGIAAALALALAAAACSPVGPLEALGTVAERRGPSLIAVDTRIQDEITFKAARAGSELYARTSVITYLRRVLLTGIVPSEDARRQVEQIARAVEGVGDVYNELIVGAPAASVDDGAIEASFKSRLIATSGVSSVDFRFRCFQGTLFIIGWAKDAQERQAVLNIARNVGGVRDVREFIRVL